MYASSEGSGKSNNSSEPWCLNVRPKSHVLAHILTDLGLGYWKTVNRYIDKWALLPGIFYGVLSGRNSATFPMGFR